MPEEIIEINARMDDDFNDGLISGDKWIYNSGTGSLSESGGVLSTGKTSIQTGIMTQIRSASALVGDFDFSIKLRRRNSVASTTVGFFLGSYDDVTPTNAAGYLVGFVGTQWKVTSRSAGGFVDQYIGSSHLQDIWYKVRIVRTGTEWKFYLDDILVLTTAVGHTFPVYFTSYRYWKEVLAGTQYGTVEFDDLITSDFSSKAHIGQTLPFKTCLPVDKNTRFLAHYDITEDENLYGISPVGPKRSIEFDSSIISQKYIPTDVIPTDKGTIEFWFNPKSFYDSNTLFENTLGATEWKSWISATGQLSFRLGNSSTLVSYILPSIDTWYHVAITWDKTNLAVKLYINGILRSTQTQIWVNPLKITIAGLLNPASNVNISEFRVWNDVKTSDQVTDHMNNTLIGNEFGLVSNWRLDDGEGDLAVDSSVNKKHTSIINGKWSFGKTVATLRHGEGKYGGGIAIEEGTTNGISYPNFQSYSGSGGMVYTVINEPESYNGKALHVKYPSGAVIATARIQPSTEPFLDSGNHTVSFYAKGIGPTVGKKIRIYTGVNWYTASGFLTPYYTRFILENLPFGTTSGGLGLAGMVSPASDDEFIIHSPQVETKPFATSFTEDTRPKGNLAYPIKSMDKTNGSLSFWYKMPQTIPYAATDWDGTFSTTDQGYTGGNSLRFSKYMTSYPERVFGFDWNSTTGEANHFSIIDTDLTIIPNFDKSGWNMLAVTWENGSKYSVYLNGVLMGSRTALGSGTFAPFDGKTFSLFGMMIDELRVDKITRTEDEIKQWYYSQSPFFPKGIHRIYA